MRRSFAFMSAMIIAAWVVGAGAQPEKGGPPKGAKGAAKFELGRLLPPFVRGDLNLSEEQSQKIQELERSVKQQLEKILTAEQLKKLSELPGKGPKGPKEPPGGGDVPKDKKKGPPGPLQVERAAVKGGIQWFATWDSGRREAQRSGRPILLVSAAPHCAGVSGVW